MIIRKIKKDGIVNGKKIIKRAILIIVVLLLIKWISALFQGKNWFGDITPAQVGTSVVIQGYLNKDNNFPNYTHSIVDEEKNMIGLKSATVNLNAYSGKVEIVGKVEKFLKRMPIIEVTALKIPDEKLIIKSNTYFFAADFFLLDFSWQPQLSANKSGTNIVVIFDGKEVVQIERFACGRVLRGKTCESLIGDYAQSQKDNFTSLWGYSFYKHGSGTWVVFEGDDFGYIFKNIDDDMMLNLSNMIKLVNRDFVVSNKLPEIRATCGSEQEHVQSVTSSHISYAGNAVMNIDIKWQSTIKNVVNCTMSFDARNQRTPKLLSFTPERG